MAMASEDSNRFGAVQQRLLTAAGFNDDVIDIIRKKFADFASPDGKMNLDGLKNFLNAHCGLLGDAERAENYFRAFDDRYHGILLYNQFITGLAALDPSTGHGVDFGDLRSRYIFRFYCREHNAKGFMNADNFRDLAKDIVITKDPHIAADVNEVNKRAGRYFQHFELDMSVQKFIAKVGSLQLRGTASLFRGKCPSVAKYFLKFKTKAIKKEEDTAMDFDDGSTNKVVVQTATGFQISHCSVYVTASGCVTQRLVDVKDIAVGAGTELPRAVSQSTAAILRQEQQPINSNDQMRAVSCATDLLRGLDYFCRPYAMLQEANSDQSENGVEQKRENEPQSLVRKPAMDWHYVKKSKLASCLLKLCGYVKPLLAAEPRCLELQQPIYVLGDLHGNFEDLHEFERLFWPMGPEHCLASILCLGDYVDRGLYGVEVVAYLFSLKILAPEKVFLLRGNHEMRDQQAAFTFKRECTEKFGDQIGEKVWEAVNLCFDVMPLAAIIDGKIFCVHGGIPHTRLLRRIPADVPQNDLIAMINAVCPSPAETFLYDSVPWELMWNDPVWDGASGAAFDSHGFRVNSKRGTGHEFSCEALEAFLTRFGLSHLIRAHQVQAAGFQVRYNAKCLTVFSSSMYSGLENEAAVVLVNNNAIKVMRASLKMDRGSLIEKENDNQEKADAPSTSRVGNLGLFAKR